MLYQLRVRNLKFTRVSNRSVIKARLAGDFTRVTVRVLTIVFQHTSPAPSRDPKAD
jgi:hypothetical protein